MPVREQQQRLREQHEYWYLVTEFKPSLKRERETSEDIDEEREVVIKNKKIGILVILKDRRHQHYPTPSRARATIRGACEMRERDF